MRSCWRNWGRGTGSCWAFGSCSRLRWIQTELHAPLSLDINRWDIGRLNLIVAICHAHCCSRARCRTALLQVRRLVEFANSCPLPAAHVEINWRCLRKPMSGCSNWPSAAEESEVEKEWLRLARGRGVVDICLEDLL
jgi:hypothetical protein